MTEYSCVTVDIQDATAIVSMNRPDAMNSFDGALRAELGDALRKAAVNDAVRVIVLTGSGRAFSAGADLKQGLPSGDYSVEEQLNIEYKAIFDAINRMDKPVIAAINGSAAGVGLSVALTCDMAVMSEKAFFLSPFTTISLVGDGGANWLLTQRLGYQRAYELSVFCERIDAETSLRHGLVNHVVDADKLMDESLALAKRLSQRAPLSLAATKKAMRFASSHSFDETFEYEAVLQKSLVGTADNVEGVGAFFEKRKPKFIGK